MRFTLALILLLSVVATLDATSLPSKMQKRKAMEFYSALKLKVGCFGKATVAKWFQKKEEFAKSCMDKIKAEYKQETATEPAVEYEAAAEGSNVFFSARKVNYLKKKTDKTMKYARCFLDNYNLTITANGQVDAADLKDIISQDVQVEELRQYVIQGFEKCEKKTACGTYDIIGAENADLIKKVKFFRCARAAKLKACIKYDLNQNKDMFDLAPIAAGVEGVPQDLDELQKMMLVVAHYASADKTGLYDAY